MNDIKKDFLYEMLEKLMFDKRQLSILKDKIELVSVGQITPKELRKHIIDFRVKIVENMLEFFPFYLKQVTSKNEINKFSSTPSEDLQEKNNLLEELSVRINKIYTNLKEKFEV